MPVTERVSVPGARDPAGALAPDAPAAGGSGLCFEELYLERRGRVLLTGLTAHVAAGTTLAVMGPSGAGKTTLLRTVAGLTPPGGGSVVRPAGRVAIVFQDPRLLPWRTALQNVELVLAKGDRHRAREWLARVGLDDAAAVYPGALSGGMRQRVSIARALACDSPVVLVDEPFSNLDVVTAARLRQDLTSHLHQLGRTVVWVTHDPAEAAAVAGRTLIMAGPPAGSWHLVHHGPHTDRAGTSAALTEAMTHCPQR